MFTVINLQRSLGYQYETGDMCIGNTKSYMNCYFHLVSAP